LQKDVKTQLQEKDYESYEDFLEDEDLEKIHKLERKIVSLSQAIEKFVPDNKTKDQLQRMKHKKERLEVNWEDIISVDALKQFANTLKIFETPCSKMRNSFLTSETFTWISK
jgi:hypothetical protein